MKTYYALFLIFTATFVCKAQEYDGPDIITGNFNLLIADLENNITYSYLVENKSSEKIIWLRVGMPKNRVEMISYRIDCKERIIEELKRFSSHTLLTPKVEIPKYPLPNEQKILSNTFFDLLRFRVCE